MHTNMDMRSYIVVIPTPCGIFLGCVAIVYTTEYSRLVCKYTHTHTHTLLKSKLLPSLAMFKDMHAKYT